MSQLRTRWLILAAAVALAVAALLAFWPVRPPPVALPNPNGYDDIVKAGALLAEFPDDYRQLPEPELRRFVVSNAPALELLRTGLGRECRVPFETSQENEPRHVSHVSVIKLLASALAAEGKLAEIDGFTNRATRSYVDAMRLGHEASRGGPLLHVLVGHACASIGMAQLEKTVSALDANDCREVIQQLQLIEARRQPPEETLRLARNWSYATEGFFMRVAEMIAARTWDPIGMLLKRHSTRQQAAAARQSRIVIALAIRAFEMEQGRAPSTLTELVPDYLPALPPETGTNVLQSAGTQP